MLYSGIAEDETSDDAAASQSECDDRECDFYSEGSEPDLAFCWVLVHIANQNL